MMKLMFLIAALAAAPTVEQLESLPAGQRQTADHHHRLARAHQAAGHPGAAAEALAHDQLR